MASTTISHLQRHRPTATSQTKVTQDPTWVRWLLTTIALLFVGFFLLLPLGAVFAEAFRRGIKAYFAAFNDADALSSIRLTLLAAAISVPASDSNIAGPR